jgi:hypothetical protein
VVEIEGRGSIVFTCKNGEHRVLTGVYYIPRLTADIISFGQLEEVGCRIVMDAGVLKIYEPGHKLLAWVKRSSTRLYLLELKIGQSVCLSARITEAAWQWHARFGHISFGSLRRLASRDMVCGLPPLKQVEQVCDACLAGKHRRSPFPEQAHRRAAGILDLVHGDLCGPISPTRRAATSSSSSSTTLTATCGWCCCRARTTPPLQSGTSKPELKWRQGANSKALCTDRGGEFTSIDFGRYCAERGVHRQLTAPYSPQQNGVVERRNQSVVAMVRCMLKAKNLPGRFWGGAVTTAVYIQYRGPTRALDAKTPFEVWHGERPHVHYLRTFGCLAYVKNSRPGLNKLDDRNTRVIFVGYEIGSKAYRFYNPNTERIIISRDAVFDEAGEWKWNEDDAADAVQPEPFVIEYTEEYTKPTGTGEHGGASPRTPTPAPPAPASPIQFVSPPTESEQDLVNDHDDNAPLRFRALDTILGPSSTPGFIEREFEAQLHFTSAEEPSTFAAAEREPSRHAAMVEEMDSIIDNGTWELVELPPGHRAISLQWVFKVKRDEHGNIVRYKARLVAKGYVQRAALTSTKSSRP